jgi:hypothetical protein
MNVQQNNVDMTLLELSNSIVFPTCYRNIQNDENSEDNNQVYRNVIEFHIQDSFSSSLVLF